MTSELSALPGGGCRSVQCGSADEVRRVYRKWVAGRRCLSVSALAWCPDASFDTLYEWERYETSDAAVS